MTDAIAKIESFASLGQNWDSYGAQPLAPETIAHAKLLAQMLRDVPAELNPAPGADGTIGFEICWPDGRELWIDVGPGEAMSAYIPKRARAATVNA